MKAINYNITTNKGVRTDCQPIYQERHNELQLELVIPLAYKKYRLTAVFSRDGKRMTAPVADSVVSVPVDMIALGVIELAIQGELEGKRAITIKCESIEVKSLNALEQEYLQAFPAVARMADEFPELVARIEGLEKQIKEKQFFKQEMVI